MRIAVLASGSRGDVEPYVALGKGLGAAGHEVRLVTHENYRALVEGQGVAFWPVAGNAQDIASSAQMRQLLAGGHFLAIMAHMAREAERGALAFTEGGLAACCGMELIAAGIGGLFVGVALAEKLELPLLQAYYIPFTPTGAYPSFLLPGLPVWFGGALNRLSFHIARQVMWQPFREADRRVRQMLSLPGAPFGGPFDAPCTRGMPTLYGYSPAAIPKPADWGPEVHVTGYWFLDPPADWAPPPELVAFLEAGPPPVYVGFGSIGDPNPEETTELILAALAQSGQRGVLLSGWGGLGQADLPDTAFVLDSVPFAWLFPRVAAVVHHGGAGTTAAGLRAGVPSVVVPFFADQPFWGRRVAQLGVGPAPIARRRLTAERLARAIEQAVMDEEMRGRAAEVGAKIRVEDGIARAVAVVREIEEQRDKL